MSRQKKTEKPKGPPVAGSGVAYKEGVMQHNGRGRLTRFEGQLTERQGKFVEIYVRNGGQRKASIEGAGYISAHPSQLAADILKKPHIQRALRQEREKYIATDLANTALATMRGLMEDESTPAATRFNAAKWSLEAAGHNKKDDGKSLIDKDKPLNQMSIEELETFISAGRQALDSSARDSEAVDAEYTEADDEGAQDTAQIESMLRLTP